MTTLTGGEAIVSGLVAHGVDTVRTRTGFRKTEFDFGVVKLNDREIGRAHV